MRTETITTISDYVDVDPANGYEIVHDQTKGDITSVVLQVNYEQPKKQLVENSQKIVSPVFNTKLNYTITFIGKKLLLNNFTKRAGERL